MVSTVEGRLRDGVGLAELLAATFPGGSITGAPKIAAVDLIAEIEPVGRGASMGALGRVYGNGDLDLALTIRTFAIAEGQIHLWVGGGVVWDSDPEAEIAESWVKADPLLRAIGAPRVEPDERVERAAVRPTGGRSPMSASGLLAVAVSGRGLVDPGEPVLAPDDEGFTRGRAAFETMRVYGGRPFRLAEHLARLQGSAERIGLERPDAAEFEALAALALERAGGARGGAPALLVAGAARRRAPRRSCSSGRSRPGSRRRAPAASGSSRCCIRAGRRRGCSRRRSRRATPSRIAAEAEAKERGADDAVFVDADGIVLEGPVTNIWWREGDVLLTPSLEVGILAGETRAALLELARGAGRVVEEGVYPLERLLARRRGVHVVIGARGDAGRRAGRASARARPCGSGAPGGAAPRRRAGSRRRDARVATSPSDDEIGAADRVVALDVAILRRHPDVDPRASRGLAVARDRASEPHVVGRLDPDANGVGVAELAVEGADALDDHDAGGLDRPRSPRSLRRPSRTTRTSRPSPRDEWRDDLALEAVEVEALAVPELVRRDDLGSGNHPRERRLPRRAVSADADEGQRRRPAARPR